MRRSHRATLATAFAEDHGRPYASLVTVATDQDGAPLLLLSRLADHTRNIAAEPRVSLLFDGTEGFANPQQGPRVTVIGTVAMTELTRHRHRFLARHPAAALYADFQDFAFHRVEVERVHFVGGFARALWLDRVLAGAEAAQGMAECESSLCAHMNGDHPDTLRLYARVFLNQLEEGWRMAAIDPDGCDLALGERVLRLDFPTPVAGAGEARQMLAHLARKARAGA
ncbi:MAG: DUF2470 domain-containing protein [Rhodospirillales bacterium]|nr:DUF2470 domain-containing protein [Rhodospirillales bacterium]